MVHILVFISSLSFLYYGIAFFRSPYLRSEFKRFGLEKQATLVAVLELLGAVGLLVGLQFSPILLIASGGLATLMLLGVLVRIRVGDSLLASLPALIFMVMNGVIFYWVLKGLS